MMENILFLARRLFLCGMLSALGMTLVKGSSQENTMRLCCACLMVITIFGALPQMKTGMDWSLPQKETMEQAAQRGLEEGWESQKELICTQAEEYLESHALAKGISCWAVVEGEIDEEGVFSVKKAEILPAASLSAQEKETLRRLAEESLGLAGEQVIIGEGEGHGEEMDDAGIYPEGL